jgi:hypothetical protein
MAYDLAFISVFTDPAMRPAPYVPDAAPVAVAVFEERPAPIVIRFANAAARYLS